MVKLLVQTGFQCFDFARFHAYALKISDFLELKNLRIQLEKVSFYALLLNIFARFYRNFDIITLHRFQTTYQNLFSKFDLDCQKITINCVPTANVVGFLTPKHGLKKFKKSRSIWIFVLSNFETFQSLCVYSDVYKLQW